MFYSWIKRLFIVIMRVKEKLQRASGGAPACARWREWKREMRARATNGTNSSRDCGISKMCCTNIKGTGQSGRWSLPLLGVVCVQECSKRDGARCWTGEGIQRRSAWETGLWSSGHERFSALRVRATSTCSKFHSFSILFQRFLV